VTVEEGKSFRLNVVATGSTLSYQWKRNGQDLAGATSAEFAVSSSAKADEGSYVCVVTGGCGVVTTNPVTVTVTPSTSVEEELAANGIVVLGPLPATDRVAVRLSSAQPADWTVVIHDVRGNRVAAFQLGYLPAGTVDAQIPLSNLSSGSYTLELTSAQATLRTGIVVSR